jgi:hypothetical protein
MKHLIVRRVFATALPASMLLAPGLASAHAHLQTTVPPVGSTVAAAPAELQLQFSEGVEPRFSTVVVTAGSGGAVNAGAIHTDPNDAKRVLVPVGQLAPGTYTVTWHAVSVDTHKTQGSYRFTIAP